MEKKAIIEGIKKEIDYFENQVNKGLYKQGQLSALVNKIARLKSLLKGYEEEAAGSGPATVGK